LEILTDANKFVITFKDPIMQSAPHIYLTALPFSPLESKVSQHFHRRFPHTIAVQTGRAAHWPACILRLDDHTDSVTSVAFSPDGELIVSGSRDCTIRVWDVATGDIISGPFEGHTGAVTCVTFSPDGKQIISGSEDRTIRIWDVWTGKTVCQPSQGHTDSVLCVVCSPNGRYIASGSEDKTIQLWDARTGEIVSTPFLGHKSGVVSIAFLGKEVVSCSNGRNNEAFRCWDLDTGNSVLSHFNQDTEVYPMAVSPDGKLIISYYYFRDNLGLNLRYQLWDVEAERLLVSVSLGDRNGAVTFSPGNQYIAQGSYNNLIEVFDAHSGSLIAEPFEGHTNSVTCIAFSPDGKHLVSGSVDQTARVWEVDSGVKPVIFNYHRINCVALSPSGKYIVSGSSDHMVRIWDSATGDAVSGPFKGHTDQITSMAFALGDENRIVSGSHDLTIRMWDVKTGRTMLVLDNAVPVGCVALSPDGKCVVYSEWPCTLKVWDVEAGCLILDLMQTDHQYMASIAFSPDGKLLVSRNAHNRILVWNATTWTPFTTVFETGFARNDISSVRYTSIVAFSPDGKRIISGASGDTVRIWEVKSGNTISESIGHTRAVICAVFSLDGQYVVSGSTDKTIRVWDATTGTTIIGPLVGHGDWVSYVGLLPDGLHAVSCSLDGSTRVWDIGDVGSTRRPTNAGIVLQPSDCDTSQDYREEWSELTDGWIRSPRSELLFWVPPWDRQRLCWPRNTVIIGQPYTKLDLSQFVHGTSWQKCKKAT
jgi:WD40 repeat protein